MVNVEEDVEAMRCRAKHGFLPEKSDFDLLGMMASGESHMPDHEHLPDVRDGLSHRERIVLWCLHALQKERGDRHVPTGMLYGSVVEHVNMTVDEMQSILVRLVGHPLLPEV